MREIIQKIFFTGLNWFRTIFSPSSYKYAIEPIDNVNEEETKLINKSDEEETKLINNLDEEEIILYSPKLSIKIPEPKYYMFLDTETTGIPEQKTFNRYFEPYYTNYYDDARMIELGYLITDDVGNKIKEESFIIKPNGFEIKNSHIHGITTEIAMKKGVHIRNALEILYTDLQTVEKLICHNTNFDKHILLSECYREYRSETNIITKLKKITKQCTMEMGKKKYNFEKPPKLVELYKKIFGAEPVQTHRALSDVYLCYDCYFNFHKS